MSTSEFITATQESCFHGNFMVSVAMEFAEFSKKVRIQFARKSGQLTGFGLLRLPKELTDNLFVLM